MMRNQENSKVARSFQSRKASSRSILSPKGQAAVEFALISVVAMIVLFVAVQLALIGEDALALGQMNYQGARWAAVNTCATDDQILNYILVSGSPSVTQSGGSCGTYLTMSITDTQGAGPASTRTDSTTTSSFCTTQPGNSSGCATTAARSFGTQVTIKLTFGLNKAIFLLGTNNPDFTGARTQSWLGLNFPTQLTSTETAMAE
jgi:hypothetical protein